ncbi:MAG: hypothetical protein QXP28_01405 [Archaeoglobaceae archaeon]
MISALIFSMNRVENVVKLSEKIKGYVDEIVIIDSSDKEKFEEMKNRIPYARIYWLPPLGMADFYYKIGLELCKNEWILHLDDDEEPSDELLKDLKLLIGSDHKVYSIWRISKSSKMCQRIFRLFHKNYIVPSGVIHLTWFSKVKPVLLDRKYHIVHYEEDVKIEKIKNYAIIDSWQFCCKICFLILETEYYTLSKLLNSIRKIGKIISYKSKLGKFGWFLLSIEFNIFISLYRVKLYFKNFKYLFYYSILYSIFFQIYLLKDFSKKLEASLKMWEIGVFEFLGLDSYENALKTLEGLDSKNGLENFVRLVKIRLRNF